MARIAWTLLTAALVAAWTPTAAWADNAPTELSQIERLERELAEIKAKLVQAADPAKPAMTDFGKPGCGCEPECGCWRFSGGVDFLLLRPHYSTNPALRVFSNNSTTTINPIDDSTTSVNAIIESTPDFGQNWNFSPRIWIWAENPDGVGFRGRYFRFDHSADSHSATASDAGTLGAGDTTTTSSTSVSSAIGGISTVGSSSSTVGGVTTLISTGDSITATSDLYLSVLDLEVTYAVRNERWTVVFAGGVRYAFIEQKYSAIHPGVPRFNLQDGFLVDRDIQTDSLFSRQTFNGAGPMVALEVARRCGCRNIELFANSRAALLFGRGQHQSIQQSNFYDEDFDGAGNVIQIDTNTFSEFNETKGWEMVPVLEIELGAQCIRELGHGECIFRTAVVGQAYWDGGNASTRNADFGLIGLQLGLGFRY